MRIGFYFEVFTCEDSLAKSLGTAIMQSRRVVTDVLQSPHEETDSYIMSRK